MPTYRFSRSARLDLCEITDYTVDTWGLEQARRYNSGLKECFGRLAVAPQLGRACDRIRVGYRRFEYEKHVVLYRVDADGIFVSRIFHQRMLPRRHVIEDEVRE